MRMHSIINDDDFPHHGDDIFRHSNSFHHYDNNLHYDYALHDDDYSPLFFLCSLYK